MDIVEIRGVFEQPGAVLNPLGLKFHQAVDVRVRRIEAGGSSFAAYWYLNESNRAEDQLVPKDTLIPLLRQVARLFERQREPWRAYDAQGRHQLLIDEEIRKQLSENARRFPCALAGSSAKIAQKRAISDRRARGKGLLSPFFVRTAQYGANEK